MLRLPCVLRTSPAFLPLLTGVPGAASTDGARADLCSGEFLARPSTARQLLSYLLSQCRPCLVGFSRAVEGPPICDRTSSIRRCTQGYCIMNHSCGVAKGFLTNFPRSINRGALIVNYFFEDPLRCALRQIMYSASALASETKRELCVRQQY